MLNIFRTRSVAADATASLILPGLGQLFQKRWLSAAWFIGLTIGLLVLGGVRPAMQVMALVAGLAINVWAAVDAAYAARRRARAS